MRCVDIRARAGRILVIQTAKIGDFVATTPVFRALRNRLPQVEIVALLHPVNVPLAEGLDSIDRIIALPKPGFKGWAGKRWLLDQLAEGYDGVLVLSPNLTTLLAPFWACVPQRVSVLADRRQGSARLAWPFLTHGEAHVTGRLFRETALRALAGFGIGVDTGLLALANEIPLTTSGKMKAQVLLGTAPRPLVGLGLGAGNRMKALAPAQLQALALGIVERTAATLILIGTAEDSLAATRSARRIAGWPGDRHHRPMQPGRTAVAARRTGLFRRRRFRRHLHGRCARRAGRRFHGPGRCRRPAPDRAAVCGHP